MENFLYFRNFASFFTKWQLHKVRLFFFFFNSRKLKPIKHKDRFPGHKDTEQQSPGPWTQLCITLTSKAGPSFPWRDRSAPQPLAHSFTLTLAPDHQEEQAEDAIQLWYPSAVIHDAPVTRSSQSVLGTPSGLWQAMCLLDTMSF